MTNDDGNGPGGGSVGGINISAFANAMAGDADDDATSMLINYNERCKASQPAMFRDEVIAQTLSVLIGHNKPNPLLVGPAGVGKTRIVEEIARRIEAHDPTIPPQLLDHVVWELPLSNIVAGSGMVGDLEKKAKAIVEFTCDPANKCILFVDEVHQLSSGSSTYAQIAQILKPAMARGDIRLIGATTLQEARDLTDDPALNRRFSRVIVDEFTPDQTAEVLRSTLGELSLHYEGRVIIGDGLVENVVSIADMYSSAGSHRPDNAITLMDRAMADAIVTRRRDIANATNPAVVSQLESLPIPLRVEQVRRTALRLMTGHAQREDVTADMLAESFAPIMGQDSVIKEVTSALVRDGFELFPRRRPLSMLFVGPSGVGKTEVATIIGRQLTHGKPITLNMTEYHSPASINRIIGSPAGYVGSTSNAELPFDILDSNPYQVILLDEFEKADPSVQKLFMRALDEGTIQTARGKNVDFTKAIVIATTNATQTRGSKASMGFTTASRSKADERRSMVTELSQWFDVELLNRFRHIIRFNRMSRELYANVVADMWAREMRRLHDEHRMEDVPEQMDAEVLKRIVEDTYVDKFGMRPAEKAVHDAILDAAEASA